MGSARLTIAEVNRLDRAGFVAALASACENSPWVIERSWAKRSFADVTALHEAIRRTIAEAEPAERIAFLNAHPDLAGKAARAGAMTADSVSEQASAGLDRLSEAEYARFERLNRAYRDKFGFPFIVAVRKHTKASLLDEFARRLDQDEAAEIVTALAEIGDIIGFRLELLFGGGSAA
jgi:2-oxo-4-hydroxy-4-carboxy-5-ureidoimidazoline decarboxylase